MGDADADTDSDTGREGSGCDGCQRVGGWAESVYVLTKGS